ncbi:hypothetical protein MKW94_020446 [Papaver nudicaule]|uniref:RRM domain-containing protein n=1 Tax=Papaver nudicaule TaxID=74823 RepID=A0AA41VTZ7_PAPNU|nr:hypothetical protein [Papaver nudicaule]
MAFQMTIEELQSFHRIDRDTYRMLAIGLGKDPLLSMAVISLWFLMEEIGYPSIILDLLTYHSDVITSAFDEAMSAVYYIITSTPPPLQGNSVTDMPTTLRMMQDHGSPMYISKSSLFEHGVNALIILQHKIGKVCYRLFADIFIEAVLGNVSDTNFNLGNDCVEIIEDATNTTEEEPQNSAPIITGNLVEPEPVTSLPNTVVFGNGIAPAILRNETDEFKRLEIGPSSGTAQSENVSEIGETSSLPENISEIRETSSLPAYKVEEQQIVQVVPACQRTMFVTFSRGFPISEYQLREFFVRTYGDCIENLFMQEIRPPQRQSMYAKVVFRASETIDEILAGEEKVRFILNGRHIQARRFEVREGSR